MFIPLALLGILIETMFLRMLGLGDLRHNVISTIILQVWTSVFYLISTYLILKIAQSRPRRWTLAFVVATGMLFRLTLWPLFPAFSDDVFRYRWEGRLQSQGGNPYQVRPADPRWASIRDSTFSHVVLPEVKAGYGPLTELLEYATFAAASRLVSDPFVQVFWFKLPGALFDLGIIAALCRLLQVRGLPMERALIYAWCPLPIFEFWASGHNDSIAVFFVIMALVADAVERWNWAAMLLGLAVAAKIWPAILLPLFVRSWRSAAILAAVLAVCTWPYRSNVTENIQFTSGFLGGWRNNDLIFGFLFDLTGNVYRAKYLTFGILAALIGVILSLRPRIERGVLIAIVGMLAISANVHPWYLTWFLPLLALIPASPLLLWTALMPLTYVVLIDWLALGMWNGSTAIRWYVYVPVLVWSLALTSKIPIGAWRSHIRTGTRS